MMAAEYTCPNSACQRVLAREDRRKSNPLVLCKGTRVEARANQAPRLKCPACGKVLVLLKGVM